MGLLTNAKWVAFSQFFKVAVQLINIIVLARLIPPAEYGVMAMALIVTNFANLIRDLGTAAAIIQRQDLQERTINAVFWLNVLMGCGIALFVILSSSFVSDFFHEDKLYLILILLSLSFPLASSSSAHLALLEKKSRFKEIAYIEISSSFVAVIIAVILAYLGFGVYSLVAQAIILALISTLQIWSRSDWRPKFSNIIDLPEIKGLIGFSGNLTLFNFINYFSRNIDGVIIGRYMSVSVLGAYSLAYRIMLFPIQNLTFVASRALFPIFSEHQNDNVKLKDSYLDTIYFIFLIVTPLMLGVALLSQPFMALVFGNKWQLSALILVWLAPTGIIQAMLSTSGTVFMAKGRTDILMRLGCVGAFLQVGAFVLGARYDVVTFTKLYFIANIINFFPVMYFSTLIIGSSIKELIIKLIPLIIASLIYFASIKLFISHVEFFRNIDSFLKLFCIVFLGAGIYFCTVIVLCPRIMIRLLRKKMGKNTKIKETL